VTVAAGSKVGFQTTGGVKVFHVGPAALYLGKAPGSVADWDGSGQTWFKVRSLFFVFRQSVLTCMSLDC